MTDTERELIQRLATELDLYRQLLRDDCTSTHRFADEARALLAQSEPEGPPLEPRGCPTPGACSCPTSPTVPPELIRALELAEAELADISDAKARAAQDLPRIRIALDRWGHLAQPKPKGPTVMEIIDLADEIEAEELGQVDLVRRALARWGRPAIEPVPVSERLPGEGDCDPSFQCWWFTPSEEKWILWPIKWVGPECSHWLPHYALPIPTFTETP
jgi:hypothetical protein